MRGDEPLVIGSAPVAPNIYTQVSLQDRSQHGAPVQHAVAVPAVISPIVINGSYIRAEKIMY